MVDNKSEFFYRAPQINDLLREGSPRDDATAVVDAKPSDESEDVLVVQAHSDRNRPEGHVTSEVNHNIEGTIDKDEVGRTDLETKGGSRRALWDTNQKAVAKNNNKNREATGNADQVHENIDEVKDSKSEIVHGDACYRFLANQAAAIPITKAKPRVPPWNKGLKMKKASGKGQVRKSRIIIAVEERVQDEIIIDWNEEAAGNIVDNTANPGEVNTDVTGLADDDEPGMYNDQAFRDDGDGRNVDELNTEVSGLADDEEAGVYNDHAYRENCDEHRVDEVNTEVSGFPDDEEAGVYNDRAFCDGGDEGNVGGLNAADAEISEDKGTEVYNDGAFRDGGDEGDVCGLDTDDAGIVDDQGAGVYYDGAFRDGGDDGNVGGLDTDVAGFVDDEGTGVYNDGAFRDGRDEGNVDGLDIDDTGFADEEDTGAYHQRVFHDLGSEDNVEKRNTDAAGFADDEDNGVYAHRAFHGAGNKDNVDELNTDPESVVTDEEYHYRALRDASDVDQVDEVYHHWELPDDENNVEELNTDAADVADDEVYHHRELRDDENNVYEMNTDADNVVGDEVYRQRDFRDASDEDKVGIGVDEDEAVRIYNRQVIHDGSDEPMGDALGDPLNTSSRNNSSDLTSYNTDSNSPNTITKATDSSEGYAGIDPLDQAMEEQKGIIFNDTKDVIMGEEANGNEDEAKDGPGETAQSI